MKGLQDWFSIYFHGLKAAVAPTRSMPKDRFAFVAAVWHTIFRLAGRIDRLITRWKNGTLPKPGTPRPGRARTARTAPKFRLPGGHMWLIRRIQGTAFAGSQLAHLIATNAELHAFLEAAPQGRRLLNPLCRMLGVDFDKPTGVLLPKPQAPPEPEPAANPAPEVPRSGPPGPVEGASPSAATAPGPPLVFSSP